MKPKESQQVKYREQKDKNLKPKESQQEKYREFFFFSIHIFLGETSVPLLSVC